MKDIVKYILEAKDTKPLLKRLYNVVCNDTHDTDLKNLDTNGVIDVLKDRIGEDEDCDLTPAIIKKIFKGYEKCTFDGAVLQDYSGDEVTDTFLSTHGDDSDYDHIMDWADTYDYNDEIAVAVYEDTKNNILLVWSGYDMQYIFLAKK